MITVTTINLIKMILFRIRDLKKKYQERQEPIQHLKLLREEQDQLLAAKKQLGTLKNIHETFFGTQHNVTNFFLFVLLQTRSLLTCCKRWSKKLPSYPSLLTMTPTMRTNMRNWRCRYHCVHNVTKRNYTYWICFLPARSTTAELCIYTEEHSGEQNHQRSRNDRGKITNNNKLQQQQQ